MPLSPADAEVLSRAEAKRYALVCLIETSTGPVRCWTGAGPLEIEPDEVDGPGGLYLGIGLLGDLPDFRSLIGGTAERLELVLSGVDHLTLNLADEAADTVLSAPVKVGLIFFDSEWRNTPPTWFWEGTADVPSVEQDANGADIIREVRLSVVTAFAGRTRPRLRNWTDADQRRRSPDDAFCSLVAGYSIDSTIKWPA